MPLRATPNRFEIASRVITTVPKQSLTNKLIAKGASGKVNQVIDPAPGVTGVTYKVRFFTGIINEAVYTADELVAGK